MQGSKAVQPMESRPRWWAAEQSTIYLCFIHSAYLRKLWTLRHVALPYDRVVLRYACLRVSLGRTPWEGLI